MGEVLTDIVEWMSSLPVLWAYFSILVIAYGENVVPPIPGDMIIVFGGYMAGIGRLDMFAVIILSTMGGSLGFMTMYVVGNRIGRRVSKKGLPRWIPRRRLEHSREMLARWGNGLILANRFLLGLRSVISITVGMAGRSVLRTTVYATMSALAWSMLLVGFGYGFGENWEAVSFHLKTYGSVVFALITGFVALQLLLGYRRRKSTGKEVEQSGTEEDNTHE